MKLLVFMLNLYALCENYAFYVKAMRPVYDVSTKIGTCVGPFHLCMFFTKIETCVFFFTQIEPMYVFSPKLSPGIGKLD